LLHWIFSAKGTSMSFLLATVGTIVILTSGTCAVRSQSFYPERLEDHAAVYLDDTRFGAVGDGVADDTAALQKAIDAVAAGTHQGIVFVPEGRYRISHTIFVWPGIRVIGFGAKRPILLLGPNTPGYGGDGPDYMVMFTGGWPGEHRGGPQLPAGVRRPEPTPFPGAVPTTAIAIDANPGTFYSAMSNIDFEVGEGNTGAVGIRFHVAQHCFLSHMDFHIGSGLAALHDIGNEAEDVHFFGGRYGIMTGRPSPGWQFTLLDSSFEGQREAAIREHEAGLVLIHDTFRKVPSAVDIEPNAIEELWIENSRFEEISGPAIVVSRERSRLTEINIRNVLCDRVPVFVKLRESGTTFNGKGALYKVTSFTHGLVFDTPASTGSFDSRYTADTVTTLSSTDAPALTPLPSHSNWTNALANGAKGDGVSDDTAVLQHLIDTQSVVYLPSGRYRITDTLHLRTDTVLLGLHPSTTQLDLSDSTPGFDGVGPAKPMLLAPSGAHNIVMGIGLFTGGINSRAVAAMWMAGPDSLMDDVRFLGGHGTNNPNGTRMNPYNSTHGGDPNPLYRWDAQYPSLWVANGGGGTFADIWTPDTFAQAGLYISDTQTPGHVYELSSEHHVRNEVKLNRVANWEIVALQTEEERGESGFCLPLSIQDSHDVTIAEMHAYRVVSSFQPFPETIHVSGSRDIEFRNLHIYSDSKAVFDSSVRDDGSKTSVRELEIAALDIPARDRPAAATQSHIVPAQRLVTGFFNASSPALDPRGRLYFVDTVKQHIFRYTPESGRLEEIRDNPIDPANIFFDRTGDLMVVSYIGDGTVYSIDPDGPADEMRLLKPEPTGQSSTATMFFPVDHWRFTASHYTSAAPSRFLSPDGKVSLPAHNDFITGALYYGTKMADELRGFALAPATPGKPFYITDEGQNRTYSVHVNADGSFSDIKLFAEQGGEGVATAPDGNVYIAAGQVYAYRPDGTYIGEIDVAERPTCLLFNSDGRTLYILARSSLYSAPAFPTK
jgi:sugar lactone lactonase YvrE